MARKKTDLLEPHQRWVLNALKAVREELCKAERAMANGQWNQCGHHANEAAIQATRIRDYVIREKLFK
jgi:hypothetical protein